MSNILSLGSISDNNIVQFCKHLRIRTRAECVLVTVQEEEMTQRCRLLINAIEVSAEDHTDTHRTWKGKQLMREKSGGN